MVYYDRQHKQLLTPLCRQCPDTYYNRKASGIPSVGCCSYSPVFTLFELHTMVKEKQKNFFLDQIYHNPANSVLPYEIVIHAHVHPSFITEKYSHLSAIELADEQERFSVCQFFAEGQGCSLPQMFKTSICRSFICPTIEESLPLEMRKKLNEWLKEIHQEVKQFNLLQQDELKKRGWDLRHNVEQILIYLEKIKYSS